MKPKLLDLCCGAGGAAMGYFRAGFDIVGVDIMPQPNFPFRFVQDDALDFVKRNTGEFDAVPASPPCQGYSITKTIHRRQYKKLIPEFREALQNTGKPYVIENVIGAPLRDCIKLCGTMFGLNVYRHRLFESNILLLQLGHTKHMKPAVKVGRCAKSGEIMCVAGHFSSLPLAKECMGIGWMTRDELAQEIPPAYTTFVGLQVKQHINGVH